MRKETTKAETSPFELTLNEELRVLRLHAHVLSQRLSTLKRLIEDKKALSPQNSFVVAIVDGEECTGCGICYGVCAVGAISVNRFAKIDTSKCTACLACVKECPQGAIAIKYL
jgi:ferredoxin